MSSSKRVEEFFSPRVGRTARSVALVALLLFILIAVAVVNDGAVTSLDAAINSWLHAHTTPGLTAFFLLISKLHSNLTVTIIVLAICAYLWSKRLRDLTLFLVLAVFGGMLLNVLLKISFARGRPHFDDPIVALKTFSFPSGHTMLATVFYGALCTLAVSGLSDRRLKIPLALLSLFMIALVGFSRMYLGAHYLSDVLGATMEGVGWIAFSLLIVGTLYRRRHGQR